MQKPEETQTWKNKDGVSYYVEQVTELEDGFVYIQVIPEKDKDDINMVGTGMTLDEWDALVRTHNLAPA